MRLATYNVENLYTRARALNLDWSDGRGILNLYAEMNDLLEHEDYTSDVKGRLLEIMKALAIDKRDESHFVILRQNRGQLVRRSMLRGTQIVASGRHDWVGWLELKSEVVNETATRNSAQVVRDVGADVLAVNEVEGRSALLQFSGTLLPVVGARPYEHIMLIDGNDDRGIDVGIMTRPGYGIQWMKSHVDDKGRDGGLVFSRDCPEFAVETPAGNRVWVLVNHFKSKGYGDPSASAARRRQQAARVAEIYERLKAEGATLIAVTGDLNDTPDSAPLEPLLKGTELRDIAEHHAFHSDGHTGTLGNGTAKDKLDYILLSPELFDRVSAAGVWRKGVWGGRNGRLWEIYPEITRPSHAASDHAALWVDFDA